ncbi:MAG: RibD family protein [Candidatus Thermoplasmatota archaeon]|nr:RibD family protein [Candidatus Thermoplasmatota archaeon]
MKPRVLINFACSLDGKIALKGGKAYRFSNPEDLQRVHKMRSESDIILVGKNTINLDDPKLVVNEKYFKSDRIPDVAILDSNLTVNKNARVFSYPRKVIIFCRKGIDGGEFGPGLTSKVIVRNSTDTLVHPDFVVRELGNIGYRNIMLEGGKSVITSFITEGEWDEISIFYSPTLAGDEGIPMFGPLKEPMKFEHIQTERLGNGFLVTIKKAF